MKKIQNYFDYFYECSFPLTYWVRGTDILEEIVTQVNLFANTLHQLYQFKEEKLLIPKLTLSSHNIFTFWVHESIINDILDLHGVRGGFQVSKSKSSFYNAYKSEKQSPRPPRILLDLGCDSLPFVNHLKTLGLEVVCLWEYIADLYHHEIIELCSDHCFDLFVSTNELLFTPSEEWLDYLMPQRTSLFLVPKRKLRNIKNLAHEISRRVYTKRKFKIPIPYQKQLEIENNISGDISE